MAARLTFRNALLLGAILVFRVPVVGATNSADEGLELRPPLPEIPPTFWEVNGTWMLIAAAVALCVSVALVIFFRRPRPQVQIPPAVRAREELQALREEPENGATLSRISHTLRGYLQDVFHLGTGEMTTTEVRRALEERPEVGSDLASTAGAFLSDCDVHKFSPTPPRTSVRALDTAITIIEMAEKRVSNEVQGVPPESRPGRQSASSKPAP